MDLLDLFVKIGVKDEASERIGNIADQSLGKLAAAARTAAKALAGMWAVKKVVDFGRAAFDAYSEFEQLAGGAKKIFDEIDQSTILADASSAWKTLNMSANEYLAAINQTGAMFAQTMGDEKGYETAKRGMQAISDYATGTGRNINELNTKFSMITRATSSYQSIADQFAGILPATSKDFLEQAQAAGILSDSYKKLTDVPVAEYQEAVSKMLEKGVSDLGLANNTAHESLTTLSGSILATKSAWDNFIAEIGKPDANIEARASDLMDALFGSVEEESGERTGGLIENVSQEVQTVVQNIASSVPQVIDAVMSVLPESVSTRLQAVVDAFGQIKAKMLETFNPEEVLGSIQGTLESVGATIGGVFDHIAQSIDLNALIGDIQGTIESTVGVITHVFEHLTEVIDINTIVDRIGQVVEGISGFFGSLGDTIDFGQINVAIDSVLAVAETAWGFVEQNILPNLPMVGEIIGHVANFVMSLFVSVTNLFNAISPFIPAVLGAVAAIKGFAIIQTIVGFVTSLVSVAGTAATIIGTFGGIIGTVAAALGGWPVLVAAVVGAIVGFIATNEDARAAVETAWNFIKDLITGAWHAIEDALGAVGDFISDPVGTIMGGLSDVGSSFEGLSGTASTSMANVEGSIGRGEDAVKRFNSTKMGDKKATATVSGNAQDGSAKKNVENTQGSVDRLSGKEISVRAIGNVIDGTAKTFIDNLKSTMSTLHDRTVSVTTNNIQRTIVERQERAEGGIRLHAAGGINVANNRGPGVPLDIVGEAGPEAIVPLTSRYGREFAEMMGREAAGYISRRGDINIYLTYNAGEDASTLVSDIETELRIRDLIGA